MPLEINKRYEVEIIEADGSRSYIRGISNAVDGHLLTLQIKNEERIFNTASSTFVGITEWRELPKDSIYNPPSPPANMTMIDHEF
jgi:hypothetical protein